MTHDKALETLANLRKRVAAEAKRRNLKVDDHVTWHAGLEMNGVILGLYCDGRGPWADVQRNHHTDKGRYHLPLDKLSLAATK